MEDARDDSIRTPAKFRLERDNAELLAEGSAEVLLTSTELQVSSNYGQALLVELRDITDLACLDYCLVLEITGEQKLILYHLGRSYEVLRDRLIALRNEVLIQDSLMQETLLKAGYQAYCTAHSEKGGQFFQGRCEARLYETGLVVLPERGEPLRTPFGLIDTVFEHDYTLTLNIEGGDSLILSRMGRDFTPFTEELSNVLSTLSLQAQRSLKTLMPEEAPAVIYQAARLLREGKAARREQLAALSPSLWASLENRLDKIGLKAEYDYLMQLGRRDKVSIGLKRGLLGTLTGEYLWFLTPIYSEDLTKAGNAIAMEAAADEGGGKATYFFRLVSRPDYRQLQDINELEEQADNLIRQLNRAMLTINFRREPIYLSEEQLSKPHYRRYRHSIARIPALQELRHLFIGRIFHRSRQQWEQDVLDLLRFNVSVLDDSMRWR